MLVDYRVSADAMMPRLVCTSLGSGAQDPAQTRKQMAATLGCPFLSAAWLAPGAQLEAEA